jgi:hypothetical protein
VLYRAIQENFETFLAATQKDSVPGSLPLLRNLVKNAASALPAVESV